MRDDRLLNSGRAPLKVAVSRLVSPLELLELRLVYGVDGLCGGCKGPPQVLDQLLFRREAQARARAVVHQHPGLVEAKCRWFPAPLARQPFHRPDLAAG